MRSHKIKFGFSITELIVAMSIIAVLAAIGLPAVNQLQKSFESSARVKDAVGAAMSNARAMALAKGRYIGIRFQQAPNGDQYMVFIQADDSRWADGFSPLKGRSPIRLPRHGLVMDMHIRSDYTDGDNPSSNILNSDVQIEPDPTLGEIKITDVTSFSVIFSKAGKLVLKDVRISEGLGGDIFNDDVNVLAGNAMLYIDYYEKIGLGEETSRNCFLIVDKNDFNGASPTSRWSSHLQNVKLIYINPYTGELID